MTIEPLLNSNNAADGQMIEEILRNGRRSRLTVGTFRHQAVQTAPIR